MLQKALWTNDGMVQQNTRRLTLSSRGGCSDVTTNTNGHYAHEQFDRDDDILLLSVRLSQLLGVSRVHYDALTRHNNCAAECNDSVL